MILVGSVREKGQINIQISITGTVFIALALIVVLCLALGIIFNQVQPGSGDLLIKVGIVALLVLIFVVLIYLVWEYEQQSSYR